MPPPGFGHKFFPSFRNPLGFLFATAANSAVTVSTIKPRRYYDYGREVHVVERHSDKKIIEVICPNNIPIGGTVKIKFSNKDYYVKIPNDIRPGMKFRVIIPMQVLTATYVNDSISDTTVLNEVYRNSNNTN